MKFLILAEARFHFWVALLLIWEGVGWLPIQWLHPFLV